MPEFDKIDYALMFVIAVLAYCCYVCYTSKPEGYAPLAYFSVAEPKYQVDSQNVMSAPIVYSANPQDEAAGQSVRHSANPQDEAAGQSVRHSANPQDESAGQSVRPFSSGPVSPFFEEKYSQEGYMQPPPEDIKPIIPPHLSGGFANPLSNPQMGFLPGGMEYGVSVPAMSNLSATVTSDSTPGALNLWSTVI